MSLPNRVIALFLFLSGCAWMPSTFAADGASADQTTIQMNRKANEACYSCHSAAGIKNPPTANVDVGKLKESRLEPEVFNPSDHGVMDCRQCHAKNHYTEYPHAVEGKATTSPCTECHAAKVLRLEPQFNASVHAKNKDLKEKFSCNTCHNVHVNVIQKRLEDPRKIVAQDNHGCLECHNSDAMFSKFAPEDEKQAGAKKKRPDINQIHEWLPNATLHWNSVRCIDCHTPAVAGNKMLSHEILNKDKAEKNCLACHSADSSLKARLYRHMVKEDQEKYGFTNSIFMSSAYVVGAIRNPVLDSVVGGVALVLILGLLIHAVIRVVMAKRRKGK